jgi:F-type H+-transporting ATPase subunit delta
MAELITIARPYAEAVFKLAKESNALDRWSQALQEVASIVTNPDMHACISNPKVSAAKLFELLDSLVKTPLDEQAKNFVRLLIDNGRLDALPQIYIQFQHLKDEFEGTAEADVVSAFELTDAQLAQLTAQLEARFKRKIKASVRIDKELIGGVRVTVGDEVLDASVRGRLAAMSSALQS